MCCLVKHSNAVYHLIRITDQPYIASEFFNEFTSMNALVLSSPAFSAASFLNGNTHGSAGNPTPHYVTSNADQAHECWVDPLASTATDTSQVLVGGGGGGGSPPPTIAEARRTSLRAGGPAHSPASVSKTKPMRRLRPSLLPRQGRRIRTQGPFPETQRTGVHRRTSSHQLSRTCDTYFGSGDCFTY